MCKKKFDEYVGKQYNNLMVLEVIQERGSKTHFKCACACGGEVSTQAYNVTSGHTTSCGCKQKQTRKKNGKNSRKHGFVGHPLYFVHQAMIARCENPGHAAYPNYGGRGILVCKEWHDMKTFGEWALKSGYKQGLSIDRINNDGNYDPANCRWATMKEQGNNRRTCLSYKLTRAEAEAALREKAEREKGCEYCADHEDLAFGHDSLKRVGSIYIDKNLLVADLYSESMAVAVCYCPACGKRLEVEP